MDLDFAEVSAQENLAFFRVNISQTISMEKHHYLSAQVWQKGNKLGTYRNAKSEERFQAARFNMTLLRRVGEAQVLRPAYSYRQLRPELIQFYTLHPATQACHRRR